VIKTKMDLGKTYKMLDQKGSFSLNEIAKTRVVVADAKFSNRDTPDNNDRDIFSQDTIFPCFFVCETRTRTRATTQKKQKLGKNSILWSCFDFFSSTMNFIFIFIFIFIFY
jgi:hypothetical protein